MVNSITCADIPLHMSAIDKAWYMLKQKSLFDYASDDDDEEEDEYADQKRQIAEAKDLLSVLTGGTMANLTPEFGGTGNEPKPATAPKAKVRAPAKTAAPAAPKPELEGTHLAVLGHKDFGNFPPNELLPINPMNRLNEYYDALGVIDDQMGAWIDKNGMPDSIITGGHGGVDEMVERWANDNNIPVKVIPPDFKGDGKYTAIGTRNGKILDNATHMLGIHHPLHDNWTNDAMMQAMGRGIPVDVHNLLAPEKGQRRLGANKVSVKDRGEETANWYREFIGDDKDHAGKRVRVITPKQRKKLDEMSAEDRLNEAIGRVHGREFKTGRMNVQSAKQREAGVKDTKRVEGLPMRAPLRNYTRRHLPRDERTEEEKENDRLLEMAREMAEATGGAITTDLEESGQRTPAQKLADRRRAREQKNREQAMANLPVDPKGSVMTEEQKRNEERMFADIGALAESQKKNPRPAPPARRNTSQRAKGAEKPKKSLFDIKDEEGDDDQKNAGEPMDIAWAVLKADIEQVHGHFSRQTMHPAIQGMRSRQMERVSEQALQEALEANSPGPIFEKPSTKVELRGGRARNSYDSLAPYRKRAGQGGRNYPTQGGPDNEEAIDTTGYPRAFDEPQFSTDTLKSWATLFAKLDWDEEDQEERGDVLEERLRGTGARNRKNRDVRPQSSGRKEAERNKIAQQGRMGLSAEDRKAGKPQGKRRPEGKAGLDQAGKTAFLSGSLARNRGKRRKEEEQIRQQRAQERARKEMEAMFERQAAGGHPGSPLSDEEMMAFYNDPNKYADLLASQMQPNEFNSQHPMHYALSNMLNERFGMDLPEILVDNEPEDLAFDHFKSLATGAKADPKTMQALFEALEAGDITYNDIDDKAMARMHGFLEDAAAHGHHPFEMMRRVRPYSRPAVEMDLEDDNVDFARWLMQNYPEALTMDGIPPEILEAMKEAGMEIPNPGLEVFINPNTGMPDTRMGIMPDNDDMMADMKREQEEIQGRTRVPRRTRRMTNAFDNEPHPPNERNIAGEMGLNLPSEHDQTEGEQNIPTFQGTRWNEETGFTRGDPIDLAWDSLLKGR